MLCSGSVGIRTHNVSNLAVDFAVAPFAEPVIGPHIGQLPRRVAPGIPRIFPILFIQIEILGGEEIHRKRLYSRWRQDLFGLRIRHAREQYP